MILKSLINGANIFFELSLAKYDWNTHTRLADYHRGLSIADWNHNSFKKGKPPVLATFNGDARHKLHTPKVL